MVSKKVWLTGLGAALIGPYLALDGNLPGALQTGRDSIWGRPGTAASSDLPWATGQSDSWMHPTGTGEASGTPAVDLAEVLRFEITPDWVVSRWPHVTTVVGELEWSGMRVPLITGYQETDLVGSLSYYFDSQQRLRRIAIEGYTGDERALLQIAMQRFGLQAEPALGLGVYAYRWNREPISVLSAQYAPVVDASSTHTRRRVMLEINRPEPGWKLSPQLRALVSPIGQPLR